MIKRVFALIMAVVILVSMLPVGVFAWDDTVSLISYRRINPVYENILPEEAKAEILAELDEIAAQEPENAGDALQGYLMEDQLVPTIRSNLLERNNSFTIQFCATSICDGSYFSDRFRQAFAHDGIGDHGDYIFWNLAGWGWSGSCEIIGGCYYYTLNFQCSYNTSASQETQVTNAVDSLIESFGFGNNTPVAYKIKTIYDWICSNVTYDYEHLNTDRGYRPMYTAYGAIIDRTCVCQGYSLLLYRLLLTAGVDSRIVSSSDHAWNIANLGSSWYYADSTWDAGDPYENWWYFLAGTKSFDETHSNTSHVREDATDHGGYDYTYGSDFDRAHPMASNDYSLNACEINDHGFQSVIVKEPTCSETGIKNTTCTVCGETYDEQLPAGKHSLTPTGANAATCTTAGNTEYYTCSACGKYFSDAAGTTEISKNSWVIPAAGHKWSTEWTNDADSHWHACTICGEKNDQAGHTSSGQATEETSEICTICEYVITPPLGHIHTNHLTSVAAKVATCTDAGNKAYYICDCGLWFSDAAALLKIDDHSSVVIPAKGHTSEAVSGKAATCTENGLTVGSKCSVCGVVLAAQTETPALGHSFTNYVSDRNATCTSDGTKTADCDRDGCNVKDTVADTGSKLDHSLKKTEANAATCTTAGNTEYYTCSACGKFFSDAASTTEISKNSWVIPAAGHKWSTKWTNDADSHWHACTVCGEKNDQAGHTSSGQATEETSEICTICEYVITPPLGHTHTNHLKNVAAKDATCSKAGNQAYYVCDCGMWFTDAAALHEITDHSSVVIPAKGHTPVTVPGKAATCTEAGLTGGSKCSVCEEVLLAQTEILALGHNWGDGVVTTKATCQNEGVTTYTCSVCKATKTESIPKTDHDYMGKPPVAATCTTPGYTAEKACRVCQHVTGGDMIPALGHSFTTYEYNNDAKVGVDGTETAVCDRAGCDETDTRTAKGTALPSSPGTFTDLKPNAFYLDAVNWAVANDITKGMTATTFAPEANCTRGQVVTLLWRAAGKPEPKSSNNPFTDVKEKAFYYKAVLWAAENGITAGTSATTFSPDAACTRGQVVTFLWRAAGEPAPKTQQNPFTDVKEKNFFYKAVLWASENGITAGTSKTTFSPHKTCTRGQIVTFLYRAYGS